MHELERVKEEIKLNLPLSSADKETLDRNFGDAKNAKTQAIYTLIISAILTVLLAPTIIFSFICGIVALFALSSVLENSPKSTLKRFIRNWFTSNKSTTLQQNISQISLRSFKQVDVSISTDISFPALGDVRRGHYEISPGVFLEYKTIVARIKCDFRIIRDHMSQDEVAWVFQKILETIPNVPIDTISVVQYSSTKHFSFDKTFLDSGTLKSFYSKPKNSSSLKILPPSPPPSSASTTQKNPNQPPIKKPSSSPIASPTPYIQKNEQPYTNTKQLENYVIESEIISPEAYFQETQAKPLAYSNKKATAQARLKLLLSDIVEKRRQTEWYAMNFVMNYEILEERDPTDVSKENQGFDILSSNNSREYRRIEVKGLAKQGDIILTPNEIKAANQYQGTFYLYILDNCAGNEHKNLYILNSVLPKYLQEDVVDYIIDKRQQDEASDIICSL